MADERDAAEIQKAIDANTQRMPAQELASRFQGKDVKVLDEKRIVALIGEAVDRVASHGNEERERVLQDARRELARLISEQKGIKSRAELLESEKHELVSQVEALQRELQLQRQLEASNAHKKMQEATGPLQAKVEEAQQQAREAREELESMRQQVQRLEAGPQKAKKDLDGALARLKSAEDVLSIERAKLRESERAREELAAKVEELEAAGPRADAPEALAKVKSLEEALAAERAKLREAEKARAVAPESPAKLKSLEEALSVERAKLRESEHARAELAARVEELEPAAEQLAEAQAEVAKLTEELETLRAEQQEAQQEKTLIVTQELSEIEKRREAEAEELEKLREKMRSLTAERDQAQEDVARAKQRYADLQKEVDQHAAERAKARQEQQESLARLGRLEAELAEERKGREDRVGRLDEELNRAREAAKLAQDGASALQAKLNEALVREAEAQEETVRLRAEMEQQVRDRERAQSIVAEELKAEARRVVEQHEKAQAEIVRLQSEVDDLKSALEEQKEGAGATEAEVADLREELTAAQESVGRLGPEVADLRERLKHEREAVEAANRETVTAQELVRKAHEELIVAREKVARLEPEVADLRERLKHEHEIVDSAQKETVTAQELVKKAHEELIDLRERLQAQAAMVTQELRDEEERSSKLQSELDELRERLRAQTAAVTTELKTEQDRSGKLQSELDDVRGRLERESEVAQAAQGEAVMLHGRVRELELESERLQKQIEEQKREREAQQAAVVAELREEAQRVQAAHEEAQAKIERLSASVAELEGRETAAQEQMAALRRREQEAADRAAQLESAIERVSKERDEERGKTVVVAADLADIEARHRAEQAELSKLRDEVGACVEEIETLKGELAAQQELIGREQEAARAAQVEAVALQAQLAEARDKAPEAERLRAEAAALEERLKEERARRKTEKGIAGRLDALEGLIDKVRKSSTSARASVELSRELSGKLESALKKAAKVPVAKKPSAPALPSAKAYDAGELLRSFLRKIKLRELVQEHVRIRVEPKKEHPSVAMMHVLEMLVAGEEESRRAGAPRIEIVGAAKRPPAEVLRRFLAGLSTEAVSSVAALTHSLRLHLLPLPPKPDILTLDADSVELNAGTKRAPRRVARPLVLLDPQRREIWHAQLRPGDAEDADGFVEFLRDGIAKVPKEMSRDRIRVRTAPSLFSEPVVRLLADTGCLFAIGATDTPEVRKGARSSKFRALEDDFEVGEFKLRLVKTRPTQARLVVVRKALKKAEGWPALWRDKTHAYQVVAADAETPAWRAYQQFAAREEATAHDLMDGFATSELLSPQQRAGFFAAYVLASNLREWFMRKCVPEGETLTLRPAEGELEIAEKRDRRAKLFEAVELRIARMKPARPFKMRR